MIREWDAAVYDALPLPHLRWGRRTLGRLPLTGDETVLEAGCGTGRDTAELLDMLPQGRVIAVDGSARMLDRLRAKLTDRLDRVDVIQADLTRPLPIAGPADAAFSVATFHWIHDHNALFANIARALRPGAPFVADCGGHGNVARVRTALEKVTGETPETWHFADAEETRRRLERAGFTDVRVALVPDPARLEPGEQFETYLATVVLGAQLDRLPPSEHREFVHAVAAELAEPVVDYVRLEFSARRAGG
ncbi:class I SAM-dependent methyltransferase [Actinoallomurus sp. NPDC050550]|uniref:class I SAM-dependent methyltransferase n=1 Tax=Actinoallomurus sp. NPDC050550 TaxID=3154937 RepID=UPI0033D6D30A